MAIISCPECGKAISEKATACPHCGYPINGNSLKSNDVQAYDKDFIDRIADQKMNKLQDEQSINVDKEAIAKATEASMRKLKIIAFVTAVIIILLAILGFCLPDNRRTYICKHCGYEMKGNYWSYHNGYVCYSCEKKYYRNK